MKLGGSKTEQEIRDQLTRTYRNLRAPADNDPIAFHIRALLPTAKSSITLNWIPEQGEDIYLLLVDGTSLLKIEVERSEKHALLDWEFMSLAEYQKGLSQISQIQLAVAVNVLDGNEATA